ncbi:DoxX family membrane protein [Streptomyces sp. MBT49]|uniref:DoxX family membrane protein n=1 Tax=Streptomyces TaxID=1883 RepID=UPI0019098B08|nr:MULTISPECIES: DoxX family membrane protein [unclassified Streptomyces]MBK3629584.1 DoxX family membrane protein [Streptomyces sp. MBT49]MBK3634674.1 DoxX family membrane protein [Streptomyces sp. MBT97]
MSVDTRTPRTPTGDRSSGFDDAPALSMVKVPSDPAQIIVSHASFRVQLGASARRNQSPRIARHVSAIDDTARMAAVGAVGRAGAASGGRRRAVVWSGRSAPDDTGAHRLLQAVRAGSVGHGEPPAADAGATQVIPRVGAGARGYDGGLAAQTLETPVVGAQRAPVGGEQRILPNMRGVGSAYDEPAYDDARFEDFGDGGTDPEPRPRGRRQAEDPARHAYFPGRRMNLGVVLLPLRIFLGFISIYAGMGKLCDPVYFDGGKRGSMVKWLDTLHPWEVAEPLRQFALHHPVGSGLVIAFLQVVVGVLTVLGCWQRVAAVVGAGLSAALIVTVSWKTVPVYDTPDIIYLAAWSPLIIAGAPVYSVDGRLAAGAWRRLGPRSDLWELRRYVLRRGALVTAIAVGLTLLVGSLLGGAVRDADRVIVPGPGEPPRNELPGSPLPQKSGSHKASREPSASTSPTRGAASAAPTAGTDSEPEESRDSGTRGGSGAGAPSQTQGTAGQAPRERSTTPQERAPATSSGPSSGGSATSGGSTGGGGGSGSDGGSSSSGQPGLVGGLLG